MFVLLKHVPHSRIKPYHYEDFWQYIERPPRNKCYKLLCICSDLSEVFEAIKKDIETWPVSERRPWLSWLWDED